MLKNIRLDKIYINIIRCDLIYRIRHYFPGMGNNINSVRLTLIGISPSPSWRPPSL